MYTNRNNMKSRKYLPTIILGIIAAILAAIFAGLSLWIGVSWNTFLRHKGILYTCLGVTMFTAFFDFCVMAVAMLENLGMRDTISPVLFPLSAGFLFLRELLPALTLLMVILQKRTGAICCGVLALMSFFGHAIPFAGMYMSNVGFMGQGEIIMLYLRSALNFVAASGATFLGTLVLILYAATLMPIKDQRVVMNQTGTGVPPMPRY